MANETWQDQSDNWTTAADWSGKKVPGSADDVFVFQGDPQVTAPIAVHSITDTSNISFHNAGSSTIATALTNGGSFSLDGSNTDGGSTLSVGSTLTNTGSLQVGNAGLQAATTLTTKALVNNTGTITVSGTDTQTATLSVTAAAGFGTAGVVTGTVNLFNDAVVQFASGSIKSLGHGATLRLDGAGASVAVTGGSGLNSALAGLTTISAAASLLVDDDAAVTISGTLVNHGSIALDTFNGQGGATLKLGGLTNDGSLQVGSGGLAINDTLTTGSLKNYGSVDVVGSTTATATLDVTGVVGFGTAGVISGGVALHGDALLEFSNGLFRTIAAGASLLLDGSHAYLADAGTPSSNSALTQLATIDVGASLGLDNGATVAIAGLLTNHGTINLDTSNGQGGASLSVGTLTNAGAFNLGNGGLAANDLVSANAFRNYGSLTLSGAGSTFGVTLAVGTSAGFGQSGILTGQVALYGDALITFTDSSIRTIGAGSSLRLEGANAFVADAGSTTSNSALTLLATVDTAATLLLDNGAKISTSSLTNLGTLELDYYNGDGGSSLTVAGILDNENYFQIGNYGEATTDTVTVTKLVNSGTIDIYGGTAQAVLNDSGAAGFGSTGKLTGSVLLGGKALLEFASGQISTIAAGSSLRLEGSTAYVADAGKLTTNSALAGLAKVQGALVLDNGATVMATAAVTNTGTLELDYYDGDGGSSLTVNDVLDNENYLQIGNGDLSLADMITAASITNRGTIDLYGKTGRATLYDQSAAGLGTVGEITGAVSLFGNSLLEFASGGIGTIDTGASLRISGASAYVADVGKLTSSSALTSLAENYGGLGLENGATIASTVAFTNQGSTTLDYYNGEGGSSLTVAALDNEGSIQIGNGGQSLNDMIKASSFTNNGSLSLFGNSAGSGTNTATLDVTAAAGFGRAGIVTGSVYLDGATLLEFASGEITSIGTGATLRINGSNAFVADTGKLTTNSALTGLSEVDGSLSLENGASIATTGGLDNYGSILLDQYNGEIGSMLSVKTTLDNENFMQVGNGGMSLGDMISAASFTNDGTANLNGTGSVYGTLGITGAVVNNGTIALSNDVQTFAGAVSGFGTMALNNNSTLELDGTVAAAQSVAFNGTDQLTLGSAKTFAGTIDGFGGSDALNLKGFTTATTLAFAENAQGTGGTLSLSNGANTASLAFAGSYTTASFTEAAETGGLKIGFA